MEGEVRKLCVFADYDGPTWSQLRMRSAMVTYRSIMRMQPLTIPRSMMMRRGGKSVLYINIMRKLGGGELSTGETKQRLAMCTGKNKGTVPERKSWGTGIKRIMAVEYTCWLNRLQEEAIKDTKKRLDMNLSKYFLRKGAGTAYLMSLKQRAGAIRSVTHTNSTLARNLKVPMRRLKAGLICRMRILRHMFNKHWSRYTFGERADRILCPCGGGVQDVRHLITECEGTKECMREIDIKLLSIARRMGSSCAEKWERMDTEQRIAAVLHLTWAGRTSDKQRKLVRDSARVMREALMELEAITAKESDDWEEP